MSSHYFKKDEKVEIELSTGELIRGTVVGYDKNDFDWPKVWVTTRTQDITGRWTWVRNFKVSGKKVTKIANLEDPPWEEFENAHAPGGVETI